MTFVYKLGFREALRRNRILTGYALLMLALIVPALFLMMIDERVVRDVGVWVKPLKFMASTALFALSAAWFIGLLPEFARASRANHAMVWMLVLSSLFEVAYISVQAALGSASHYNLSDAFHAAMFGAMAIAAVMLTATQAFLAWQIHAHHRERPRSVAVHAVIVGLVLTFVLSTLSGFMLGGNQPPAGSGLPVTGWHTRGGDLRPAHFVGVHAQQFLPLLGILLQRFTAQHAGCWLAAVTVAYATGWFWLARIGIQAPSFH